MNLLVKFLLVTGALTFGSYGTYSAINIYGLTGDVTRTTINLKSKESLDNNVQTNTDHPASSSIVINQEDAPSPEISASNDTKSEVNSSSKSDPSSSASKQIQTPNISQEKNIDQTTLSSKKVDKTVSPVEVQEISETSGLNTGEGNTTSDTESK